MTDPEFNLKFVKEVEKHEILYNYNIPGYSIKAEQDKAWQKVAAEVNLPAAECKEKWRNLRIVFIRKMKQAQNGRRDRKIVYYLADAMQFCLPYIKISAPPSPGNLPPVSPRSAGHIEETESCVNRASLIEFSPSSQSPRASSSNYSTLSFHPAFTTEPTPTDHCAVEYLRDKKANHLSKEAEANSQRIDRKEGLKMFLLSLMPELEDLSNSQIKLFKRRVLNLIDEISTPQYNHQHQVGTQCRLGKSSFIIKDDPL